MRQVCWVESLVRDPWPFQGLLVEATWLFRLHKNSQEAERGPHSEPGHPVYYPSEMTRALTPTFLPFLEKETVAWPYSGRMAGSHTWRQGRLGLNNQVDLRRHARMSHDGNRVDTWRDDCDRFIVNSQKI